MRATSCLLAEPPQSRVGAAFAGVKPIPVADTGSSRRELRSSVVRGLQLVHPAPPKRQDLRMLPELLGHLPELRSTGTRRSRSRMRWNGSTFRRARRCSSKATPRPTPLWLPLWHQVRTRFWPSAVNCRSPLRGAPAEPERKRPLLGTSAAPDPFQARCWNAN